MRVSRRTKRRLADNRPDPVLIEELKQVMSSIDTALNHFEQVVDPTMIDCYIYELKAAQLRYQFLLRRIKNQELQT